MTNREVDNTAPTADGISTTNGGGAHGPRETGDTLTFTYSEAIAPGSIIAGWNGTGSQAVTVRVNNNAPTTTAFLVYNAGDSDAPDLTGANGVTLGANHVDREHEFDATLDDDRRDVHRDARGAHRAAASISTGDAARRRWSGAPTRRPPTWPATAASTTPFTEPATGDPEF